MLKNRLLTLILLSFTLFALPAAAQNFAGGPVVTGRLFKPSAANGQSQPIALEITLPEGWHTYWRNPGVAGAPPQLNWDGSTNFTNADILWPAPHRFETSGLQTFGYKERFILPLTITVADPAQPTQLKLAADLIVCTDICVPAHFDTTLDLSDPIAPEADIEEWRTAMSRLPTPATDAGISIDMLALDGNQLLLTATSKTGWMHPDVIVEAPDDISFGKPQVSVSEQTATFRLPLDNAPDGKKLPGAKVMISFIDDKISADTEATISLTAPAAPTAAAPAPAPQFLSLLLIALLGGLILNLMPCVLPVLSLKLLSVVQHAGETRAQIRRGFLASSAGIIVSFWLIAGALIIVKQSGMALGWGIQFQQPLFISALLAIVLAFTANLWGWFEISLPGRWTNKLAQPRLDSVPSTGHEFLTGMLATLLATPCTAPFVGTSVGFALAGSNGDIMGIFTALGFGLALPYLLIALFPALAQRLPRPGRWMLVLRVILGCALLATAAWLLSLLYVQLGFDAIITLAAAGVVLLLALWKRWFIAAALLGLLLALSPLAMKREPVTIATASDGLVWQAFTPERIPSLVANGKTVFVDITASWCLTCHANKKFVIDSAAVQQALAAPDIVLMRGDWTQPNAQIAQFLKDHQRAGIPFNMVAGPKNPGGIILPELLTQAAVLDALKEVK